MPLIKPFKIFIELDQPQRDLDGLLFLTCLIKKEFPMASVFLVPRDRLLFLGLYELPQIVIFTKPQSGYIPFFRLIGSRIVVHENEGIPYDLGRIFTNMSWINRKCVNQYWLWGKEQYKYVITNKLKSFSRKKLFISGGLRYEYFKTLPKSNHKEGFQFNTNFPTLSPKYQSITQEFKMLLKEKKNISESLIEGVPIVAGRRERLLNFISKLSKNKKLRIRPHPFESISYYKETLPKYYSVDISSLTFITDTDVHDDLYEVSHSFNSGCQTTLDSLIRGVIPVSIEKAHNIWDKFSLSYEDSLKISDFPVSTIHKKLNEFAISNNIEDYLFNFVIDAPLKELIKPLIPVNGINPIKRLFKPFLKIIVIILVKTIFRNKKTRTSLDLFKKRIKKISSYYTDADLNSYLKLSQFKELPYVFI